MKKFFTKKKADEKSEELQKEKEMLEMDEKEFDSFFSEVMKKFPAKTSALILKSYEKSKERAEKGLANSKNQFGRVFDEFLEGVDNDTRSKCHKTVHAAALTAAIIGCSPIPFSDAFLLVPVQLTMMARLHKIFGQSWSESMGKSLVKEVAVVTFGRSAVGNLLKLIPAVGTVTGAVINATVASTITEALGWVTVKMLNDGEDILEQTMAFKGQFKLLFNLLQSASKNSK